MALTTMVFQTKALNVTCPHNPSQAFYQNRVIPTAVRNTILVLIQCICKCFPINPKCQSFDIAFSSAQNDELQTNSFTHVQ